jgi:hypothetical protein
VANYLFDNTSSPQLIVVSIFREHGDPVPTDTRFQSFAKGGMSPRGEGMKGFGIGAGEVVSRPTRTTTFRGCPGAYETFFFPYGPRQQLAAWGAVPPPQPIVSRPNNRILDDVLFPASPGR